MGAPSLSSQHAHSHQISVCPADLCCTAIDAATSAGENTPMRLSRTQPPSPALLLLAMLAVGGLTGCAGTRENLDTMWNAIDPAGHHRYHKDKYYPHERRTGMRLPKGMEN